jgi:hypothetical protein
MVQNPEIAFSHVLSERELLKQTFEDLHGKVEGKVAKCKAQECENKTSSFCEGC